MDSARSQTDQHLTDLRRSMATDYDSLAESMSAHLSAYLSEHTDDSGLVTEDAFRGGGWERMRDSLARETVDTNRSAMESLGRGLDDVRSLTSQGSPSSSPMPHPSVDIARDLAWNRRQVESAARHAVGKTPAQGGEYMRTVADRNLNGAVRTARTSVNGAENAGRLDAMLAKGGFKRWITMGDERVRDSHAALHGVRVPVEDRFPNGLMFPCDPDGDPSEVCNCRCMIEWVEDPSQTAIAAGIGSFDPDSGIDGGFTVDIGSGEAYRLGEYDGYAVGGFGTERIIPPEVYSDPVLRRAAIRDYVSENYAALQEEGACLGGWIPSEGENAGNLFLDVSRVTESLPEATRYAIMGGEDAITDFANIDWPSTESLAERFGMMDEYREARRRKLIERG